MNVFRHYVLLITVTLLTQGCTINQDTFSKLAQSSSATEINKYKTSLIEDLKHYKRKLDLRNPAAFDRQLAPQIYAQLSNHQDTITLEINGKKLLNENEYLHYAFAEGPIKHRNDLLILGLYKVVFKAYKLADGHKFIAFQYDANALQELYQYLQVVRWRIRTKTDNKGHYLFVTWQNNWQLELQRKAPQDLNFIHQLEYIRNHRETIYDHSNFSFETLMTRMLLNVKYSLEETNIEPLELSVNALKTFVFII